jgi:N6-L-threonylcarbamoyladenine synthase
MKILGIETSCDETAVSIIEAEGDIQNLSFDILGNALYSQVDIHKDFGGVVPNLAKREHEKNLPIMLELALNKASLSLNQIDLIVVTVGPGLEPALWVGILFAKELGEKNNIKVIGANHMNGHLASVLNKNSSENRKISFPALGVLISGGHTEIVLLKDWFNKQKVGETVDDAVGEAFDKVARMLGLPYPGGPQISKLAKEAREKNIKLEIDFPRPMIHTKDLNFSFSGLKTAILYYIQKQQNLDDTKKMEIAREFEDAVIDTLITKTEKAIKEYNPKTIIIGGGVIANTTLRDNFLDLKNKFKDIEILIPERELTTDNATMIAYAGYISFLQKEDLPLKAKGNLSI